MLTLIARLEPLIPPIEGELMLEVYTHESLNTKPNALTSDEHGGSVRLATLGKKLLEAGGVGSFPRGQPAKLFAY